MTAVRSDHNEVVRQRVPGRHRGKVEIGDPTIKTAAAEMQVTTAPIVRKTHLDVGLVCDRCEKIAVTRQTVGRCHILGRCNRRVGNLEREEV